MSISFEVWRSPNSEEIMMSVNAFPFNPKFILDDGEKGINVMFGKNRSGHFSGLPEDVVSAAKKGLLFVVEYLPGGIPYRENEVMI